MSMYVMFACLRTFVIIFYSHYYNQITGFCLVHYFKKCSHQTTSVKYKNFACCRQGLLITCVLGLGIHLQQMHVATVFSLGNFLLF